MLYLFITMHNMVLTVSKHLSSYAPPTIKAQTQGETFALSY